MAKKIVDEDFEKHMHDGHRGRLLHTVTEIGFDALSEVQVLEFVLFYIFPRGDVNPLAHRLLEKYLHISSVLDAGIYDLAEVKGMGMTSAKKLKALLKIFGYYLLNKIESKSSINQMIPFLKECDKLFATKTTEYCYIFGVTAKGSIVNPRLLSNGTNKQLEISVAQIDNYIKSTNPINIILMHNHPGGYCEPSANDFSTYNMLQKYVQYHGCSVMDSYIFGENGVYSCKHNQRVLDQNRNIL